MDICEILNGIDWIQLPGDDVKYIKIDSIEDWKRNSILLKQNQYENLDGESGFDYDKRAKFYEFIRNVAEDEAAHFTDTYSHHFKFLGMHCTFIFSTMHLEQYIRLSAKYFPNLFGDCKEIKYEILFRKNGVLNETRCELIYDEFEKCILKFFLYQIELEIRKDRIKERFERVKNKTEKTSLVIPTNHNPFYRTRKVFKYYEEDTKTMLNMFYGKDAFARGDILTPTKVIFNNPATICFWPDGTKTVVHVQNGEPFDEEKGLAMCIVKKLYGNDYGYYNKFKKIMKKAERHGKPVTVDKIYCDGALIGEIKDSKE